MHARKRRRVSTAKSSSRLYDAGSDTDDILWVGSDNDDYPSPSKRRGACRRARIRFEESQLRPPVIVSAALRGPFDAASGWKNPWRSKGRTTGVNEELEERRRLRETQGAREVQGVQEMRETQENDENVLEIPESLQAPSPPPHLPQPPQPPQRDEYWSRPASEAIRSPQSVKEAQTRWVTALKRGRKARRFCAALAKQEQVSTPTPANGAKTLAPDRHDDDTATPSTLDPSFAWHDEPSPLSVDASTHVPAASGTDEARSTPPTATPPSLSSPYSHDRPPQEDYKSEDDEGYGQQTLSQVDMGHRQEVTPSEVLQSTRAKEGGKEDQDQEEESSSAPETGILDGHTYTSPLDETELAPTDTSTHSLEEHSFSQYASSHGVNTNSDDFSGHENSDEEDDILDTINSALAGALSRPPIRVKKDSGNPASDDAPPDKFLTQQGGSFFFKWKAPRSRLVQSQSPSDQSQLAASSFAPPSSAENMPDNGTEMDATTNHPQEATQPPTRSFASSRTATGEELPDGGSSVQRLELPPFSQFAIPGLGLSQSATTPPPPLHSDPDRDDLSDASVDPEVAPPHSSAFGNDSGDATAAADPDHGPTSSNDAPAPAVLHNDPAPTNETNETYSTTNTPTNAPTLATITPGSQGTTTAHVAVTDQSTAALDSTKLPVTAPGDASAAPNPNHTPEKSSFSVSSVLKLFSPWPRIAQLAGYSSSLATSADGLDTTTVGSPEREADSQLPEIHTLAAAATRKLPDNQPAQPPRSLHGSPVGSSMPLPFDPARDCDPTPPPSAFRHPFSPQSAHDTPVLAQCHGPPGTEQPSSATVGAVTPNAQSPWAGDMVAERHMLGGPLQTPQTPGRGSSWTHQENDAAVPSQLQTPWAACQDPLPGFGDPLQSIQQESQPLRADPARHGVFMSWKDVVLNDRADANAPASDGTINTTAPPPAESRASTPRPSTPPTAEPFRIRPFSSFASPSTHRVRKPRRSLKSALSSERKHKPASSQSPWNSTGRSRHLSFALASAAADTAPSQSSKRRARSPPPEKALCDFPEETLNSKFSNHFSAAFSRVSGLHQRLLPSASPQARENAAHDAEATDDDLGSDTEMGNPKEGHSPQVDAQGGPTDGYEESAESEMDIVDEVVANIDSFLNGGLDDEDEDESMDGGDMDTGTPRAGGARRVPESRQSPWVRDGILGVI